MNRTCINRLIAIGCYCEKVGCRKKHHGRHWVLDNSREASQTAIIPSADFEFILFVLT
jgi:hypothetical protein